MLRPAPAACSLPNRPAILPTTPLTAASQYAMAGHEWAMLCAVGARLQLG